MTDGQLPKAIEEIATKMATAQQAREPLTCKVCAAPWIPPEDPTAQWDWRLCDACGLRAVQVRTGIEERYLAARLEDFPAAYAELIAPLVSASGYIWGTPGGGKTHSLCAIATRILQRDRSGVTFLTWRRFKREWRSSFAKNADHTEAQILDKWGNAPHIFFDDVSDEMDGEDSYALRAIFCDLVDQRYSKQLHTVFSSNLDLAGLALKFNKKVSDRIYEGGKIIKNTLPNRRMTK